MDVAITSAVPQFPHATDHQVERPRIPSSFAEPNDMNPQQNAANRALLLKLTGVVLAMFAFGFALVPMYEKICEITGLRNIDQGGVLKARQVDLGRTVRIELDSNVRKLPWQFRPLETMVGVHPGEVRQVMFEIVNTTDHPLTGQAIPSYGPREASRYFVKLDCFCFARQTLQPGEARRMPVVFVVDPALPADVGTITLSYTFFEVEGGSKS
jgi:cytochrome c oxidase assembly protein subunit 11